MHFTWKMRARYWARGSSAVNLLMKLRAKKQRKAWEQGGRFGPPHIIKQLMLREHAQKYRLTTLVETGTFLGDMIHAMKDDFQDIYSIELSDDLHKRAQSIFKKYPHIHLVQGDSSTSLGSVLSGISVPCLFWLDGHYSAGITAGGESRCPLLAEIAAILEHPVKGHVLLVDDAICYNGHDGYPTLFELNDIVEKKFPGYEMQVFDNAIQIRPKLA